MRDFTYFNPTKIVFGKNAEEKVAQEVTAAGGSRVLLVYGGGSVVRSGLLARIEAGLENAGLQTRLFGGVQPNPTLGHAEQGVAKALAFHADLILGIGGGSVIDTAKAIAHGTANPDAALWDFWSRKVPLEKSLPVGAVVTIPAAGSETSDSAVLTNKELGTKRGLGSEWNRPKFAILNPELACTLSPDQMACSITDIMMHTLDRYFNPVQGNQFTDEIAESLLRITIENGRKIMENIRDYDAMSELMWCASVSHSGLTGLGGIKDFAVHQLGHAISAMFDTAHGASLSAVWVAWASYVMERDPARFAQYGRRVWQLPEDNDLVVAQAAIKATVGYFAALGMPTSLGKLERGILGEEMLVELTDECLYGGQRSSIGTFKKLERGDVYEIYRLANH